MANKNRISTRNERASAQRVTSVISLAVTGILLAGPAEAYVGPSLGLGAIGAVVGVLAAIVLTIFGLVWYPMKRVLGKKPAVAGDAPDIADDEVETTTQDRAD